MQDLSYLINHVFLPPKLPQKNDSDSAHEHALCVFVQRCAVRFLQRVSPPQRLIWEPIFRSIDRLCELYQFPALSSSILEGELRRLPAGDTMALLIRAQNAAVKIHKSESTTTIELFEVSLPSQTVLGTTGKIICTYPGPAFTLSNSDFEDPSFQRELASFLAQMDVDILKEAHAQTQKAGSESSEYRETTDPMFITDLLSAILAGFSRPADVKRIEKRVGDDVIWNDALLPWRRSPMWLVIRVTLQTALFDGQSHGDYKSFMLFCMTELLHEACDAGMESDLLHFMRSKLGRRHFKLDSGFSAASPSDIAQYFHSTLRACDDLLQQRWTEIQKEQARSPSWNPESFNVSRDVELDLPNSRRYLIERIDANAYSRSVASFNPRCAERLDSINSALDPAILQRVLGHDDPPYLALMDFETYVMKSIDEWVERSLSSSFTCANISKIVEIYTVAAQNAYHSNHEQLSIMLLTIFELWVALDQIAVYQCPLLRDYLPELPLNLLATLVLSKRSQIDRVSKIETYVRERERRASYGSVFDDDANPTSFAVRYYNTSSELHTLEARIRRDEAEARRAKIAELEDKRRTYNDLLRQESSMSHGQYYNHWRGWYQHDRYCEKCRLASNAASMKIEIFESPLPEDLYKRQTVVFELRCPPAFGIWRSTTYYILFDICRTAQKDVAEPPTYTLQGYRGLSDYVSQGFFTRITLASHEKSFYTSHYRYQSFPATEGDVLRPNGLKFRLFDGTHERWAAGSFTECDVTTFCTPLLPPKSSAMQYAVKSTEHTQNEVLANQSECPLDWSIHDYITFCSLRSGGRVQWLNILRMLAAHELPCRLPEAEVLLSQAAHQIGPVADGAASREWHVDLDRQEYRLQLLAELASLLNSVKENWQNVSALRVVIALTLRVNHHSISDMATREQCDTILRAARLAAFSWLGQVVDRLNKTVDDDHILKAQSLVCEMAMTCRSTYDMDPEHLRRLLSTDEDVSLFVQCAARVADNTPSNLTTASPLLARLLARDKRVSRVAEDILVARLKTRCNGIDEAIHSIWGEYGAGVNGWLPQESPNTRWITTHSKSHSGRECAVHFNVLDGTLLINGARLGRLPPEIVQHLTYKRVFGSRILDVIPSSIDGMQYSTLSEIHADAPGFHAYFLLEGNNLFVQARKKTSAYYFELIPHTTFTNDFPTPFSMDYVHWLKIPIGAPDPTFHIEFRPLDQVWVSSSQHWTLNFHRDGPSFLKKPSTRLISSVSQTFADIARRLRALEAASFVVVTEVAGRVVAELPRYRLSFFLEDEQLESHTHPGFVIDDDQSSGALFGLAHQLVMRSAAHGKSDYARRILIPVGTVVTTYQSGCTCVTIKTSGNHIRYRVYEVDTTLGRLIGDGTLSGRLYQVLLHALTSSCLPDSLTSRTGVEEALDLLGSAACSSFQSLTAEEHKLLNIISHLTPRREYYPAHLEVMQRIKWQDLPAFVQHYGFASLCQNILSFARDVAIFDPTAPKPHLNCASIEHLEHRAAVRCRIMYPSEAHFCDGSPNQDVVYMGGRQTKRPEQARLKDVTQISRAAYGWHTSIPTIPNLWGVLCGWSNVTGTGERKDPLAFAYSRESLSLGLSECWLALYDWCRRDLSHSKRFTLCFMLGAMSLAPSGSGPELLLASTLLSFATSPHFRDIQPPPHSTYSLADGLEPSQYVLEQFAKEAVRPLGDTPSGSLTKGQHESGQEFEARRERNHEDSSAGGVKQVTQELIRQWHANRGPSVPTEGYARWINTNMLGTSVDAYFRSCRANIDLKGHIDRVQAALDLTSTSFPDVKLSWAEYEVDAKIQNRQRLPALQTLLMQRIPPTFPVAINPGVTATENTQSCNDLLSLITSLQKDDRPFYKRYAQDLEDSHSSFSANGLNGNHGILLTGDEWESACMQLQRRFDVMEDSIRGALSPKNANEDAIFLTGAWPRLSLRALLSILASTSSIIPTFSWRERLTSFGLALLLLQRARRLLQLARAKNLDSLRKELSYENFDEGAALENPDWLLIQLESNFMIRPIQSRVACEMINPSHNIVLQLNMGEGKSSVITPLVATTLANGQRLVRVVVLKPLGRQMRQLLIERLGGLANRRVFYLPFSRDIELGNAVAVQTVQRLYALCMEKRGVLVTHPEHLLSFKLATIDRLLPDPPLETTVSLVATQKWLDDHARDILDESDEILHVQYQLVYTWGSQNLMEDSPHRWITISHVLRLAALHAESDVMAHPEDFEYHSDDKTAFPLIRVLDHSAGQRLVQAVARELVSGDDLRSLPLPVREATFSFITTSTATLDESSIRLVYNHCRNTTIWPRLLLLRGLLGHGLLLHTLMDRRWRVNFGLLHGEDGDKRTSLAVPYVAKDVPSQRADFGHPDVALVLTYLSHYYQGLTSRQLLNCFDLLLKQDDATVEYENWTAKMVNLPIELRSLSNINVENERQWEDVLVPRFRRNSRTIDFFLANVVFPKQAKQFTHKLSTSAWDLAALKTHPTTGFSGTNDSRFLLPTSISQVDPVGQLETNAKVLSIVLQFENDHYLCVQDEQHQPLSSAGFLAVLVKQSPPIRVLLDVGAQMLDMQNGALAKYWLSLVEDGVGAAIFFNDHDELVVCTRDGSVELLATSSFRNQLGRCLVYLDDAHTRGTDLKLPRGTRAAVTLGPKVTKDRLLQGCMRMRMLGDGHSLMFFAPPEVQHAICALEPSSKTSVHTKDILRWAMNNTCEQVIHYGPRWAMQGVDYERRNQAWIAYSETTGATPDRIRCAWRQPDAKSLEEMYGPKPAGQRAKSPTELPPAIYKRCKELDIVGIDENKLDEEQQREVTAEFEIEPQVERPPRATAEHHALTPDMRDFIRYGFYRPESTAFMPLHTIIEDSIPGFCAHTEAWSAGLVATRDFARTVRIQDRFHCGASYLRPVNWIVSGGTRGQYGNALPVLVALSQYEVNELLPDLRRHGKLRLHIYSPRLTQEMRIFDDLAYYCIPPLPISPYFPSSALIPVDLQQIFELNVFAGQLYFSTYDAYLRFCDFFAVMTNETDKLVDSEIDGWVKPSNRVGQMAKSPFSKNPLLLLKKLMGARRKGMNYDSTHVGKILRARRLNAEDVEGARSSI
ncbi:hypothetical protein BOTBODRAFT_184299 [Botryobasidium botryosum FD-172 SS1]|uniref:ubiquitinyl hydrolase 1 n=1 Tax=Botryobasidium botryosum (strain FD-172 SS1) TaxID=930990 RepID=A0A067MU01_BOTB1|nr:hypothetical protein BOTBODRAFT_184299 [Botryobasidium botryosum FD-172 SS1]